MKIAAQPSNAISCGCLSRNRDYEAANVTIRGLLRLHGRPSKPPKAEVASSSSSAASKGGDSPNLFAAIVYPSDEDEDDDDDDDDDDEEHEDEEEVGKHGAAAGAATADIHRKHGRKFRSRGGDKQSKLQTKNGRAVDKLRLLAVGVAYVLNDYETAYATIRHVCELRPSSARPRMSASPFSWIPRVFESAFGMRL
jgi:hypothetical protein